MQSLGEKITTQELKCSHCREKCINNKHQIGNKMFCCAGCMAVYSLLSENGLCRYYDIDSDPGLKQDHEIIEKKFEYLDDPEVIRNLSDFNDEKVTSVTFYIPSIHCSSCIWLLEKLSRLNKFILQSEVNFPKKEVSVTFDNHGVSLKDVVILLAKAGYEPYLALDSTGKNKTSKKDWSLYLKFGVAAFCFGNIMLLSFPEYLASETEIDNSLKILFGYFIIILSLPVFFYSASDYFRSVWNGIKTKILNIDVPLSLGIAVLFGRSVYEILVTGDPGFMDSMTGLVFLLLIGKVFKNKTFDALNFERNYKSYFPLSVILKDTKGEKSIPLAKLKTGNRILVRNYELIPADSILIKGNASIDYSFVTGESIPVSRSSGDMIFAGGRQVGPTIELEIVKDVSQSYLTRLWNKDVFNSVKNEVHVSNIGDKISKYFTPVIILIALAGGLIHISEGIDSALNVFTSVLIVACPCALAVSIPFTLGNAMRILGRNKFYAKNPSVVENMSSIDTIVFDKTGTITKAGESEISFAGEKLAATDIALIRSLARNSQHPFSVKIFNALKSDYIFEVVNYSEESGKGISGIIMSREIRIGSEKFVKGNIEDTVNTSSKVYVSINRKVKGYFTFSNHYREGLEVNLDRLSDYDMHLLSGDNSGEQQNLEKLFKSKASLHFNMSAHDKLDYINNLQLHNKKVLMLGDGLNDAGALKQSDIGISVSENINNFTPACDGILESSAFERIGRFIVFSKDSMAVIKTSFILSLLYNAAGLGLALQGLLTPLTAAVLMPVSSITIVSFGVLATKFFAKKRRLL